jgi:hypothetical protein
MHMTESPGTGRFLKMQVGILLLTFGVLTVGCKLPGSGDKPSVEILHVPIADAGGPAKLDLIEGRVSGAKPGEQIVLYAHSGIWWIQPLKAQPYTKIQPDSTWKNSTHLGAEYAALLVEPGYVPELKIARLPEPGKGVVAVAVVKGAAAAPIATKVIHFSGYDWTVRSSGSDRGGEPNDYDPANAWVDSEGFLHLRLWKKAGKWSCAEVSLNRNLGYGSYRFVVQDSARLDPFAVLGLLAWDDLKSGDFHNEFDIELSRWGNSEGKNAQFVVQPFYVPENITRFSVPPGVMSHTFRWQPERLEFKTIRGAKDDPRATPISEHVFTTGVPVAAGETVHIVLYEFHPSKSSSQLPAEVVVEKFEYFP